jgi:hypothetical protein
MEHSDNTLTAQRMRLIPPTPLDFGTVEIGTAVAPQRFTVELAPNTRGTVASNVDWLEITPTTFMKGQTEITVRVLTDKLPRKRQLQGELIVAITAPVKESQRMPVRMRVAPSRPSATLALAEHGIFPCNRTGFPMVDVGDGLAVFLLPVTKAQFKLWLDNSNPFDRSQYEEMLIQNPSVSSQQFRPEERERLLLTGVLPSEAEAFAEWLGSGYDLPTIEEWRTIDRVLSQTPLDAQTVGKVASDSMHLTARRIVRRLVRQLKPQMWSELALLRGGVIEWVRVGTHFAGLGSPRPQFYPNTFNPQRDDPVRPLSQERLPYFGFRPVRRLSVDPEDEEELL